MFFLVALVAGLVAAVVGGALSGVGIGKEALGAELAAYMGGLYGLMSGSLAVLVGLVVLALV